MKQVILHIAVLMLGGIIVVDPSYAQDAVSSEQVPAITGETASTTDATTDTGTDIDGDMQTSPQVAAAPAEPSVPSIPDQINAASLPSYYEPSPVDLNEIPSLFFTKWEHDLLIEARLGATTRPVTDGENPEDTAILALPDDPGNLAGVPTEVELGGILYVSPSDWVIWLNGARVTPKAIPSVIMDIKVFKDHIDMEWLDRHTNQIYPIRLRAHQKFNLQSRMFLPAGG